MRVRVLFTEDCPHRAPTLRLVCDVMEELGVESSIEEIAVWNVEQARRLHFLGSPTVLIDGRDIEPARRMDINFGIKCRLYGKSGTPSRDMLVAAFNEASSK